MLTPAATMLTLSGKDARTAHALRARLARSGGKCVDAIKDGAHMDVL